MKRILFSIFALCFLALPAKASFVDVYLSPTGNAVNVGNSCIAAKNAVWFSDASNWGGAPSQIGPGTTVHLCAGTYNGAVGTILLLVQGSGAPGQYITIKFEPGAILSSEAWSNLGAIHNGPDPISYIKIDGGPPCGLINHMRVECNGVIQNTNNGSSPTYGHTNDSAGIYFRSCNHCSVTNLAVINIFVKNTNDGQSNGDAVHIDGDDVQLNNNICHDSYVCLSSNWQGAQSGTKEFANNIVYHANFDFSSGNLGDHAVLSGPFLIHDNEGYDWANWDNPVGNCCHHNFAIIQTQGGQFGELDNLKFYNNYMHGDTGTNMTAELFLDCESGYSAPCYPNAQVYNNIFREDVNGGTNGMVTVGNGNLIYPVNIFNNTFYFVTNLGHACIQGGGGVWHIKNNTFINCETVYYAQSATTQIGESDYNNFVGEGTLGNIAGTPIDSHNLPQWQSYSLMYIGTAFDLHSNDTAPNINTTTYVPNMGSPLIGTGIDVSGVCSGCAADFYNVARGPYAMGAAQPNGSPPVPAATRPKVNNSSLPGGVVGTLYSPVSFNASSGVPPYTWSGTGFPTGLSLSATGVLSGTPSGPAGTSTVSVVVNDSQKPAQAGSATLPLVIAAAPVVVPPPTVVHSLVLTTPVCSLIANTNPPQYNCTMKGTAK